jgi:enediyne biosynthesis protein E4
MEGTYWLMGRHGVRQREIAGCYAAGAKLKVPAIDDASETGVRRDAWPWKTALFLAALLSGLLWGAGTCWKICWYQNAMGQIEDEIDKGFYAIAAKDLTAVLARDPGSDEAAFLLGTCEKLLGRPEAASKAWSRVPSDSSFSRKAILGLMELRIGRGRLAEAEEFIEHSRAATGADGSDLNLLLGPIYGQEGRVEEAKRFVEERYVHLNANGEGASEKAINLVRLYIELRTKATPVEVVRGFLEEVGQLAPDDDRIWLGKANLAIRERAYDEAAKWLDACLRRRPDDVPVWRARLNWAMGIGSVHRAREALKRLPASESTPAQVQKLQAWFAAQRGDSPAEIQSLERLVESDPSDLEALDRLAELEVNAGQGDRAAELRSKKTELARLQARYQKLYARNQPRRDAAEMSHLAEQLGQRFEARVFLTVAASLDPNRPGLQADLARLNSRPEVLDNSPRTLADLVELDRQSREPHSGMPAFPERPNP